jgi:Holliday junction DNA helicase RuvA
VIREDAHLLFGFASEKERSVFRELIRVSGIGSKVALSILSAMSVDEFVACVRAQDVSSLTRVPGIGKKTAERLVLEMRDRLRSDPASPAHPDQADASFGAVPANARGEAAHALIALGYKAAEAESMINRIYHDTLSVEELIRKALQSSVKR